jgi:molecular chaperone DnaK (HSP70)
VADFFGKDPSRTLNAKECVSRGAALQCAMLSPIFRFAGVAAGCLTALQPVLLASEQAMLVSIVRKI